MVNKIKAQKGQKVRVVDNLHGHQFLSEEVVICIFSRNCSDEDTSCQFEHLDGSRFWWMEPEEYEIIE